MFQVHIGRLSITSPESLQHSSGSDGKTLSITGKLGGVENELEHLKYIRDQLQSMARMDEHVPFRYDGDSSLNGYVKITGVQVSVAKYLLGSFSYSVDMEYVGREGDVMFESRLTGSLLENDFNVSSVTTEQFHAAPAGHYAYIHNNNPDSDIRVCKDLTSDNEFASVNLYLKRSQNLRDNNAQYVVDIEDYYKGCCQISIGTHPQKTNSGITSTVNSVMCGKDANNWQVGDSLILENGLIKLVLGTSTSKATVNTFIYDDTQYATEQEWIFSSGQITSGNQQGDDFAGWRRVQILVNRPEVAIVRCTTYLNTDKSGRLTVDFALRRGSHFVSVISNYYTAGTPVNFGLYTTPSTVADDSTISNGYIVDGTASPEDNNSWILGSTASLSTDTNLTEKGIIQRAVGGTTFPFFIGYILRDADTGLPADPDDAASIYNQYIDNVNESQRLIKA